MFLSLAHFSRPGPPMEKLTPDNYKSRDLACRDLTNPCRQISDDHKMHEFDLHRTILCRYFAGIGTIVLLKSVQIDQICARPRSGLCTDLGRSADFR